MPAHTPELPTPATNNMSPIAKEYAADNLQPNFGPVGDPGTYQNGVLGWGWYHIGTSADQTFIGHDNEPDYYVIDWRVKSDGTFNSQGNDTISSWDVGPDWAQAGWQVDKLLEVNLYSIQDEGGYLGGMSSDWVYDTGLPGLDPESSAKIEWRMTNHDTHEVLAYAGSIEWLYVDLMT